MFHNLSANDTIISAWLRNSSSDFWNYENLFVIPEVDDTLEKITKAYSIISGYYFKIVDDPYNGTYLPFNPASVTGQMAFTLWVNDTTLIDSFTQVNEITARSNISLEVYPNPAANQLTIEYNLPAATFTDVVLLNMFGEYIKILQSTKLQGTGKHAISANLNDLSSGVYLVRLSTIEDVITKKIVVIK